MKRPTIKRFLVFPAKGKDAFTSKQIMKGTPRSYVENYIRQEKIKGAKIVKAPSNRIAVLKAAGYPRREWKGLLVKSRR